MPLRIAILTTDKRESDKDYSNPVPGFGTAPEALLQGFATLPEVEIHIVACTQRAMTSPAKLADNIWFYSLHVPKIGWMRTLYQGCIRAVRRKLQEIQPDIVHAQGTERDAAVSAIFSGFPNVLTIHGNMRAVADFYHSPIGSFHWLAARLETLALRKTAGVFCNSAYTECAVAPLAKRTWRVPNALRTPFFDRPVAISRPARPILLNVGSLVAHKRQTEILAVARKLWQRGFQFELQFAGDTYTKDDYLANFLRQIREAESAGYARHLGVLSLEQLITAMDEASALVHFPGEEAFGLVVAEALARNMKLFAGSTGGVVDIATGVEGVELFPGQDWTGLEQSLARWLEMGCPRPSTAAAVMRQRYHPEVIARRHVEIYREVLSTCS
jgi:glycosyltransferase involved in cell wall biosynthesis